MTTEPLKEIQATGDINVLNYRRVYGNKKHIYVCRTQAGFAKALREFKDFDGNSDGKCEVNGYPKAYPCLVVFNWAYQGYHFVSCTTLSMSVLNEICIQDKADQAGLKLKAST